MQNPFKLRTADPTRRIPTYLQAHTKENLIWQLKMTVLVWAGMELWGRYQDRQIEREFNRKHPPKK